MGCIAVLGTFDSKGEEHWFLKEAIEIRGLPVMTIHVGTRTPTLFKPDLDLGGRVTRGLGRDQALAEVIQLGRHEVGRLWAEGMLRGIVSAGGGTGTYVATSIMKALPFGIPKVMLSTVASRDMSGIVGTTDITILHSVVDLLGVNSVSGVVLDMAAGAVCGMARQTWKSSGRKPRVALTLFGFITEGAEEAKRCLEERGYEVIAFHANGAGGMAMEELAGMGYFHGILDLALHEMADRLLDGYCGNIGPGRLEPVGGRPIPRLVVPGGLDCAVLEFTRENIPARFKERKIFFYDFRSGIRLTREESVRLAHEVAEKLNRHTALVRVLVPTQGWSMADRPAGPLHDPSISRAFLDALGAGLNPRVPVREVDLHINDRAFAEHAAAVMDQMISGGDA